MMMYQKSIFLVSVAGCEKYSSSSMIILLCALGRVVVFFVYWWILCLISTSLDVQVPYQWKLLNRKVFFNV